MGGPTPQVDKAHYYYSKVNCLCQVESHAHRPPHVAHDVGSPSLPADPTCSAVPAACRLTVTANGWVGIFFLALEIVPTSGLS